MCLEMGTLMDVKGYIEGLVWQSAIHLAGNPAESKPANRKNVSVGYFEIFGWSGVIIHPSSADERRFCFF